MNVSKSYADNDGNDDILVLPVELCTDVEEVVESIDKVSSSHANKIIIIIINQYVAYCGLGQDGPNQNLWLSLWAEY
jgi:hypothetical protein